MRGRNFEKAQSEANMIVVDDSGYRQEQLCRHEKVRRKFQVQVGAESLAEDIADSRNLNINESKTFCKLPAKLLGGQCLLKWPAVTQNTAPEGGNGLCAGIQTISNLETPTRFEE